MMTKEQFKDYLAGKYSVTKVEAASAIEMVFDSIPEVTAQEGLQIMGFGSFTSRLKEEHMKRNPQTGESILVEAQNKPVFKAGVGFKRALNG